MENTEKLRILLQHWIDHNGGHVAEFAKWQQTMEEEGHQEVAAALVKAQQQMGKVSDILRETLAGLGGPTSEGDHHHGHHHHHH